MDQGMAVEPGVRRGPNALMSESIDRLHKHVSMLEDSLQTLRARLEPATRPVPTAATTDRTPPHGDGPVTSTMTANITEAGNRVARMIRDVNELLEALDL